jgi:hypothetical protein
MLPVGVPELLTAAPRGGRPRPGCYQTPASHGWHGFRCKTPASWRSSGSGSPRRSRVTACTAT